VLVCLLHTRLFAFGAANGGSVVDIMESFIGGTCGSAPVRVRARICML
jgi:hypothetical protein